MCPAWLPGTFLCPRQELGAQRAPNMTVFSCISRVLCIAVRCSVIYLGLLSPTGSIDLPTGIRRAAQPAYLVFQPLRFTWHPMSPWNPVGSYPTISPITCESLSRNHWLVYFLLHLLFPDESGPFLLGSKVPYAARTFLPHIAGDGLLRRRFRT